MASSRACEACQALKVKCEPSSEDASVCERCSRLSLACVPAARKWQRDRITELEEENKNLREHLRGITNSTLGLSNYTASTRATSVFSDGAGPRTSTGPSALEFLDARLDEDTQLRCLKACTSTAGVSWYLIPHVDLASAGSWLDSLRNESPVKLISLLAFTICPPYADIKPQTQEELRVKVLEILGQAAIGSKPPSLDLIQAALISGLWLRSSIDCNHANPNQLVSLAHNLGVELGLGGKEMQSSAAAYLNRIQEPQTLEMKKTWLASWMASTMTAVGVRNPHDFDWGQAHFEALHALEAGQSDRWFLEMVYTMRLFARVANDLELCNTGAFHDINSDLVVATRNQIYDEMNELIERPLADNLQLRFWRMLIAIHVNEPVLHTATNKALFAPPYISERIGVNDFACGPITSATATALRSIVEACHLAISIVLEMYPITILCLPSLCFGPAVSYTLSILIKVFVAVSAPGNTYSQILTRESLHVREAMAKLIEVKEELLKIDPQMGNWNTRIIGSVEWLGVWLDDYENIIERYEENLQREVAEQEIGGLSPNGHF
ncbi:cercosporin resistance [Fusarium beomiforme]|uniref:Cercosporin resistance n=1 Tax=Fusarium beomiforme TaxID=44412 RepID=A0A9P5ALP3_9HYPO|nr:cercosporin resistance [Fusarium beomiforme]